jgi:hypothetical protein
METDRIRKPPRRRWKWPLALLIGFIVLIGGWVAVNDLCGGKLAWRLSV